MRLSKPLKCQIRTDTLRYTWGPWQCSINPRFYSLRLRHNSVVLIRSSQLAERLRPRYHWDYPVFEWRPHARVLSLGKLQITHRK